MTAATPATSNPNVNTMVTFAHGQVPDLLKKIEALTGIALSLRSTSGDVVVKTDYFFGPCSVIRGTERGRLRCRRTYKNIEERLLRRKVPFVNVCYAGFLVFAAPIEFRGEMVGTLLGSQILPQNLQTRFEREVFFDHIINAVGIKDREAFYQTFDKVRYLNPDFERVSFMSFLETLGENFSRMAFAGKSWPEFFREMQREFRTFRNI
ncbi:MAG: hypothetical protein OZSIB_0880 [Candidatus Ozemobacter sibiricus]|uniref:PocR domain-containing protein n=1 Tax=Candidatus Ozemobacter sibiricus TaxID=2268124 RepID=A0A367ZUM1_9BACT|nr:MAG: hypothetical protein OZSIB_0880 [Candidatus Ozemobacter sibiricus]